jgi:cyclophilin family peptidyl-prolyl cis-trans isomerase
MRAVVVLRDVRSTLMLLTMLLTASTLVPAAVAAEPQFARVETEAGNLLLVFYPELAPRHVANFIHLSENGFYDGLRFHRIVPGFVIQGGDPNSKDSDPENDGMGGPRVRDVLSPEEWLLVAKANEALEARGFVPLGGEAQLKAELSTTAKHRRGTLSMARGEGYDSAGSQFFICVADAPTLDGEYTIFGQVVSGLETADRIVSAELNRGRPQTPSIPVQIIRVSVIRGTAGLTDAERKAWSALPDTQKNVH